MRQRLKKDIDMICRMTGSRAVVTADLKRHVLVAFEKDDKRFTQIISSSPSDIRTLRNQIADVKRGLRGMNENR